MHGFKTQHLFTLVLPLAFAAPATVHAQAAPAAEITVGNCNDSGAGSLRAAVSRAANGDTINMRALTCRRLVLTSGAIRVPQANLTVLGPGRAFVVDGNRAGRVFEHAGTGTLRLRALSIANGYEQGLEVSGGCIDSRGDVRLEYVRVHGCEVFEDRGWANGGGGIAAAGDVALYNSEVFDNLARDLGDDEYPQGGGIWAKGELTLVRSRVSNNSAEEGWGGGFYADGGLDARYSEVSGNAADAYGALYASGGEVTIAHSLIAGNQTVKSVTARLGSWDATRPITVVNTTVSGNSAWLHSGLSLRGPDNAKSVVNSTIVNNQETRERWPESCAGALSVEGTLHLESTLIASNSCDGGRVDLSDNFEGANQPLDIVGSDNLITAATVAVPSDTISANPRISPLADNGGRTRTHALWAGSPAVDMGNNNAGLRYDERGPGFDRVKGGRADIGAYER